MIHDLRRTGARNLRREGLDTSVIMRIGGWKTDSVFRRYNIVDLADIADAAARMDVKRQRKCLLLQSGRQSCILICSHVWYKLN